MMKEGSFFSTVIRTFLFKTGSELLGNAFVQRVKLTFLHSLANFSHALSQRAHFMVFWTYYGRRMSMKSIFLVHFRFQKSGPRGCHLGQDHTWMLHSYSHFQVQSQQ